MKRISSSLLLGAFLLIGTQTFAQDSLLKSGKELDVPEADQRTPAQPPFQQVEADTTPTVVSGTTASDKTLEEKIRAGEVSHSFRDAQKPGEWNESAQGRLSPRETPADALKKLRGMEALQYNKRMAASDENNWMQRLGQWVIANIRVIRIIFFCLLGAILLAAIILFASRNDIPVFRRRSRQQATADEDGILSHGPLNYEALAREAITAGNLREAVRMRYLQALQLLEGKQLIAPGKDKTNMDYLRELSTTAFHKPFAALTLHYEYVWYGKAPLNNAQFSRLNEQFLDFKNTLR